MKETQSPFYKFIIHIYAKYEATWMAITTTPLRLINFACYDFCVLPFVDVKVEEHSDHVTTNEDD
jgi:hypothetical protein